MSIFKDQIKLEPHTDWSRLGFDSNFMTSNTNQLDYDLSDR